MSILARFLLKHNWKEIKKKDAERLALQTSVSKVVQVCGIPYTKSEDPMHTLNVYFPQKTSSLLPVIVDIHGGGWMYGDRDLNKNFCMYLASKGFAVIAMSYRLLPSTDLKGQVQDVFACLNWLNKNARSYNCDMQNAFLTGDSAGGHLSALCCCIMQNPDLQKLYAVDKLGFTFRALGLNHAVCDVYKMFPTKKWPGKLIQREMLTMMLGEKNTQSEIYKKISFSDICKQVKLPPTLVISSEADGYHQQSVHLIEQLRELNADYKTLFSDNKKLGHVYNIGYPNWPESMDTNDKLASFFKTHIKTQ